MNSAMDKYERVRVLGQGSFGKALLVRERSTGELRVMKEMKTQNKQELEEAIAEAEIHATLSHGNIVKYREVFRTGHRTVFIVMDYAPGGDLSQRINRQKVARKLFSIEKILMWIAQACKALHYLHRQGKIHRDIKAANMFLTNDDDILLGDFGIARVLDLNAARISARTCKTPVGTPMYMSPEQANAREYGQAVDIWALGCVFYELVQLKPAFIAQSLDGLMSRIRRGRYDRKYPTGVSQAVQDLIGQMLAVDPEARPTISVLIQHPLIEPYLTKQSVPEVTPELAPVQPRGRVAPLQMDADETRPLSDRPQHRIARPPGMVAAQQLAQAPPQYKRSPPVIRRRSYDVGSDNSHLLQPPTSQFETPPSRRRASVEIGVLQRNQMNQPSKLNHHRNIRKDVEAAPQLPRAVVEPSRRPSRASHGKGKQLDMLSLASLYTNSRPQGMMYNVP